MLPIAVGILAASGQLRDVERLGETALGRGGQPDRALLRLAEELPAAAGR